MYTAILQLLSLAVAVAAAPTTACNKDNCLRAVGGSAFPTMLGTQDCSSYFLVTVTPPTSTQTQLFIIDTTATNIYTTTQTSIETDTTLTTATSTVSSDISITNTQTEVDTITQTITISATETITDSPARKKQRDIADQQVTVSPSGIPSYASYCSGPVRYSSACSCLGVTRSTITAPSPITTITITTSSSTNLFIPTITSVTSTYDVVLTDGTGVTAFFTETATATTTIDVSTTVSDTVISTQTVIADSASDAFYLLGISSLDGVNGNYAQLDLDPYNRGYMGFTSDFTEATIFQIDAAGHLTANGRYASVYAGGEGQTLELETPAYISSRGQIYVICSLPRSGLLSCNGGGEDIFQALNDPSVDVNIPGYSVSLNVNYVEEETIINLQAICAG